MVLLRLGEDLAPTERSPRVSGGKSELRFFVCGLRGRADTCIIDKMDGTCVYFGSLREVR